MEHLLLLDPFRSLIYLIGPPEIPNFFKIYNKLSCHTLSKEEQFFQEKVFQKIIVDSYWSRFSEFLLDDD